MTQPPSDHVVTFYDESERFVRFLAGTDKKSFLALVDLLARHQPFDAALARVYVGTFVSPAALEEKFREYASKDFGTSLQQAGRINVALNNRPSNAALISGEHRLAACAPGVVSTPGSEFLCNP